MLVFVSVYVIYCVVLFFGLVKYRSVVHYFLKKYEKGIDIVVYEFIIYLFRFCFIKILFLLFF